MIKLAVPALLLACALPALAYECDSPVCPEECPPGSFYYPNGDGVSFCVFDSIRMPVGAVAACDQLAPAPLRLVGWIGYTFPLVSNIGYQCSPGFARGPDVRDPHTGAARGLCFAASWPQHPGAFAYCGYLTSGCDPAYGCYEGYGWKE